MFLLVFVLLTTNELTGHKIVVHLITVQLLGQEENLCRLADDALEPAQCVPPHVLVVLHQPLMSL